MAELSLIPDAAWREAQRRAEVTRRSRSASTGRAL